MLDTVKHLEHYAIEAADGSIGHVRDVYFDDHSWVVRYLVVDTGGWLPGRKVLISPISVIGTNVEDRVLTLSLTREQVKESPDIDTDKPISRQHELSLLGYYGYPYYWGTGGLWGTGSFPAMLLNASERGTAIPAHREDIERVVETGEAGSDPHADVHLRSCSAVTGYRIEAADGHMGEVKDFLVEESTWAIRYLIVNTSEWWSGHDVLVAVRWIDSVRWMDNAVTVTLTRQAVKDSPAFDPEGTLDREHEAALFKHHGKTGYWDE
ncbi:MAG: PRC-barrel domain-containing protein [Rhodanobacter sp.]